LLTNNHFINVNINYKLYHRSVVHPAAENILVYTHSDLAVVHRWHTSVHNPAYYILQHT